MKKLLLIPLVLVGLSSFGQSVISSVNSGALANSGMIFSVGEIFVLPASNPNEANSGLIGAVSRIEFLVTGIDEALYTDLVSIYPNPASHSVFIDTKSNSPVSSVYVYDADGKLVLTQSDVKKSVDLSGLNPGTYLIKTNLTDSHSFKIIKQ